MGYCVFVVVTTLSIGAFTIGLLHWDKKRQKQNREKELEKEVVEALTRYHEMDGYNPSWRERLNDLFYAEMIKYACVRTASNRPVPVDVFIAKLVECHQVDDVYLDDRLKKLENDGIISITLWGENAVPCIKSNRMLKWLDGNQ